MVSERLGETTSNSGFVLCFNTAVPCDWAHVFVPVRLQCACLPAHKLAMCVRGCVYHARRYSAISHRAGVIQSDLE